MNIGLIFGGKSAEYEVSLLSARSIYENIDKKQHTVYLIGVSKEGRAYYFDGSIEEVADGSWINRTSDAEVVFYSSKNPAGIYKDGRTIVCFDIFFPVMHGPFGEDGKFQGMLELSGLPYVGCGVLSSALSMDKDMAKRILSMAGICSVPYEMISSFESLEDKLQRIEVNIGYPCFIKPANMGSSVGISKAINRVQLHQAIQEAFLYDDKILVEKSIDARELEISVLGNRNDIRLSEVGEIIPAFEFYDYDAKYKDKTSQLLIPAPIGEEVSNQLKGIAQKAYQAIGAEGLSRIDFFMDKQTGVLYLNEINSMPGFTPISMYPKLWEYSGLSYDELIDHLMQLALERKRREDKKQ